MIPIDLGDVLDRTKAAERELRGMGLPVDKLTGKLSKAAIQEIENVLRRHGIVGAHAVLDSGNVLRITPKGRRPAVTPLQQAARMADQTVEHGSYSADEKIRQVNNVVQSLVNVLAGLEVEALASLARAEERNASPIKITELPYHSPTYKYEVDRTKDVRATGKVEGTLTVTPCKCPLCTLEGLAGSVLRPIADPPYGVDLKSVLGTPDKATVDRIIDAVAKSLEKGTSSWIGFDDVIAASDKAVKTPGKDTLQGTAERTKIEEPLTNTYRKGQQRPEARSPRVLDIKERLRAALGMPVGSIGSAMLGDALADAYVSGKEASKPEALYVKDLQQALQGYHRFAITKGSWSEVLAQVATMVNNVREQSRGW